MHDHTNQHYKGELKATIEKLNRLVEDAAEVDLQIEFHLFELSMPNARIKRHKIEAKLVQVIDIAG